MDEAIQLDREDVILLMLEANERILRKDALSGITRLEKLLFLLERETDFEGIATFFEFEAHNFGPFSKEVYEAVEFLLGCDLIEVCDKTYSSVYSNSDEAKLLSEISEGDEAENLDSSSLQMTEKQFSLTDNGRKVAQLMRQALSRRRPSDIEALDGVVRKYGNRPLNHLIRYVYMQHPDMTSKSIHPIAEELRRSKT